MICLIRNRVGARLVLALAPCDKTLLVPRLHRACPRPVCSDILNQQHTSDTGGSMVCSTCGTPNREAAKFCHRCGSVLFRDERLRQLDVCFVMDATGSMRDHIDAARKNL